VIQIKDVQKSFGTKKVLKGISFVANPGEIIFILGTSGTGKSVLLKHLVGLLQPDSGQVLVGPFEVTKMTEDELQDVRKICGMVFQHPALFDSLTVFENVAYGLRRHFKLDHDEIQKRVSEALALVHLHDIETKMPSQLSYGMQKRVSIARTIALRPKILLFDEPTTGLDPITTTAVNNLIKELSRTLKTTSLVVSHDMKCALEIADRVIVLDQGLILEEGTPEQLKKSQVPLVKDFLAEVLEI
jgi:phospholipid/cholesterol/gamma-HCH transport system ATP-binding protein